MKQVPMYIKSPIIDVYLNKTSYNNRLNYLIIPWNAYD